MFYVSVYSGILTVTPNKVIGILTVTPNKVIGDLFILSSPHSSSSLFRVLIFPLDRNISPYSPDYVCLHDCSGVYGCLNRSLYSEGLVS